MSEVKGCIFEEQWEAFPVGRISPVCNGAFKILLKQETFFQMLFFSLIMWLTIFSMKSRIWRRWSRMSLHFAPTCCFALLCLKTFSTLGGFSTEPQFWKVWKLKPNGLLPNLGMHGWSCGWISEHTLQAMELWLNVWTHAASYGVRMGEKADFHNQFRSWSFITEFVSLGKLCLMNSLNPPRF